MKDLENVVGLQEMTAESMLIFNGGSAAGPGMIYLKSDDRLAWDIVGSFVGGFFAGFFNY